LAAICSALLAPAASAAAPTAPLDALRHAQQQLHTLAAGAATLGTRRLLTSAEEAIGRATVKTLWVDPKDAVAPTYGHTVFADSRAALIDLEPLLALSKPPRGVAGAEALILAADRSLAERLIRQTGGGGGLLVRANGMVLSGDRWAETSRVDLAAEQYGVAWNDAYAALTPLVVVPTTNVPAAPLGNAAETALASHALSLTSVHRIRNRAPLTHAGLPELLFVGRETCARCAIESWGLVVALSQFGLFSNLHLSQSAVTAGPLVRGFTFHGSRYASPYVSFVPVELSSDVPSPGGGYEPLQELTPEQKSLQNALDTHSMLPFVDVANRAAVVGSPAPPGVANRLLWRQLALSLHGPMTPASQAIAGTAETLTAEICQATGGNPTEVCGSAVVKDYETALGG
jgi:hypothetical protein